MPEKFGQNRKENIEAAKTEATPPDNLPLGEAGMSPVVPEKKAEPVKDENGVPESMFDVRDQMKQWIKTHYDDLYIFLEYRQAKFELVCGMGFYYQATQERNIISISVPYFAKHLESGEYTLDQLFFGAMHEMAHLKAAYEQDLAGNCNHLAQFDYEGSKRLSSVDSPVDFVSLRSTYRQYYNITEDAVVNDLVLNTPHFARGVSGAKERRAEVAQLYTDNFFKLYKSVPAGQGDYIKNPDPVGSRKEPYIEAEPGNGDIRLLSEEDYQTGFDWNDLEPPLGRSGQFLTWFIKNQMIGLDAKDIGVQEADLQSSDQAVYGKLNSEGKMKLDKDVALALTRPLSEVYRSFLRSIVSKYQSNQEQMRRYLAFMQDNIVIPHYEEKNGEMVKVRDDQYFNIFPPSCIRNGKLNINLAGIIFDNYLADACKKAGLAVPGQRTYLDLFNSFKAKTAPKGKSLTLPLKLTQEERLDVMRKAMEPIFSMLCILDDSFDIKLPPESDEGDDEGGDSSQEDLDEPTWQRGEQVINVNEGSSNFHKKGTITNVQRDPNSKKIISVEVTYWEEVEEMAAKLKKRPTGDIEEIFNPDDDLALLSKEGKKGGKSSKDKRKTFQEKKQEKESDKENEPQEGEEGGDAEPQEGKDDKGQPGKPKKSKGKPKGEEDQSVPPQDLGKITDPFRKSLEDMIAAKEREQNLKEIEAAKKTDEYHIKRASKEKAKKLIQQLKEARAKQGLPDPVDIYHGFDLSDEGVIKDFLELEKKIEPYANEMAKAWLEVVNNISHKVQIFRDKYYPSGRMDIKRVQQHWPEIIYGAEIDNELIYSRLVERIQAELRPRMLRMRLLIDNSGSMGGSIEAMRMCVMLLNSSLRSFRELFRDRMKSVLGGSYTPEMDLVCDTELNLFGDDHKLIKTFDVNKFEFLSDSKLPRPKFDLSQETLNTLLAFGRIDAHEGTQDITAWEDIALDCDRDKAAQAALQNGLMTEVIFQVSDGDMSGEEIVKPIIDAIHSYNIATMGFAIGNDPDKAVADLKKRHDDVIKANTPQEIVSQFGRALKKIIVEQIEAPMERILDEYNKAK